MIINNADLLYIRQINLKKIVEKPQKSTMNKAVSLLFKKYTNVQ